MSGAVESDMIAPAVPQNVVYIQGGEKDPLWMRPKLYCQLTGESNATIMARIKNHEWAAGNQFKRTSPKMLWISYRNAQKWITDLPHVEGVFPQGLKD